MQDNNTTKDTRTNSTANTVKEATIDYLAMLNKSISNFNNHRANVEKEIKNGGRLTTHRISI